MTILKNSQLQMEKGKRIEPDSHRTTLNAKRGGPNNTDR